MFKLPQRINFLAGAVISLNLTALVPASATQEPGGAETVKQSISQEYAQNANAADYLQQGLVFVFTKKDFKGAEAAFRKAIELDPSNALAHNNLGAALYAQGKLEEAIAEYSQAIRLDPINAFAHTNLWVALANQGRLEEAVAEHKQAIRLDPNDAFAHTNLEVALVRQGKLEEAIAKYKQAIRLDPNNAEAHANLGFVLAQQGEREEAIAAFKKARDLFKAQGKTQEANQVEQMMRQMGAR